MASLYSAPVLSTPETHIFEDPTTLIAPSLSPRYTDAEIYTIYEVERTAQEITTSGWRTVALQFPDSMLRDATRVFEALENTLAELRANKLNHDGAFASSPSVKQLDSQHKLCILGDTSYGACCVDEIAAEHADAEVVVHYGRSCLSPTARLPVIYVFTSRPLDLDNVIQSFESTYKERGKEEKIVLVADIVYNSHISEVSAKLKELGWSNLLAPEVIHDPASLLPNRKIEVTTEELKDYSVFHISDPPPALLLTLNSRVKDLQTYATSFPAAQQTNSAMTLRRRYALLTSLSTNPIFGILINTLSVRNYLETVTTVKEMIEKAGKKSYTFVVGKVNAAKIANFSEIGGWVVIGCWESSLIESTEFYRPIVTPFELQLTLQGDSERIWGGEWRGYFGHLDALVIKAPVSEEETIDVEVNGDKIVPLEADEDSEEESAPPEYDLRTGRYVSHSRPLRTAAQSMPTAGAKSTEDSTQTLVRRAKMDLATVNGVVSPGAEYLKTQRTWTGLGSDFQDVETSQDIEEGRSGIARGYTVRDNERT
ncbi:putative diphthamide synthesis protein-domain-containing protein [Calycina marina]|uniref:2-(3-amino-3-carboxypropyl)histidine synthase subunit 2 n=1 Tax=Calycina marina TaxID=1763456 RepID=A0A9P7YZT6_9HELO|nr:putative diphthamide synthesis protein-domain-containing protein [Calycina marina]